MEFSVIQFMSPWHLRTIEEVLQEQKVTLTGLPVQEAASRLTKNGRNELKAKKNRSPWLLFFRQFLDVMILVLLGAAALSVWLGELSDSYVIIAIVLINAVVGFIQEYRAEKAMEALQKISMPVSKVLRDGKEMELPSGELVLGDLVLLESGNRVPADLRLFESHSLKIDESGLTGESQPIDKTTDPLTDADAVLGDRTNMGFSGTNISNGRGKGVVVATGMETELGKIAGMLQEERSTTPLQQRMSEFSKKLTVVILLLCAALFAIGYLRGEEAGNMLLTSLSLAVAAIPEALPAVITVSLALGAKRMVKQQALIRKLYAVETLGSVSYICTDKTGTLTKNKMEVKEVWAADEASRVLLIKAMALNNDVKEKDNELTGDPTEVAMLRYARENGPVQGPQDPSHQRVKEIPFDAERKAMSTLHAFEGKFLVITKGAAESIAAICVEGNDGKAVEEKMAQAGMRVLGFGVKELDAIPNEVNAATIESGLRFLGLVGLVDPPREEATEAIQACKHAGIIPVMITGDHPITAATIARQIGILEANNKAPLTGKELAGMSDEHFKAQVKDIRVYARVSPEQKLRIIQALQEQQQFVSMTGDGVNDAPALKRANIGVAMGITGADVTKEAAHMILLDDNFATIIKAVREGRRIYDNIRKFIQYILTGNAAEIWCIFLAPLVGLPIPLLPVHILWVNLVTDGLPALALAAEPSEKESMERPPRPATESIFAGGLGKHIIWMGILIGLITVATQWLVFKGGNENWQTMVFTVLCFSQLWHVLAIRREKQSVFSKKTPPNHILLFAVLATVALQLAVIYLPFLNRFFHTKPLTTKELLLTIVISSLIFWTLEIQKFIRRKRSKRNAVK